MKKRVVIDLVPIRVGEGGTGSGIWTYARELLANMDASPLGGMEVICFANRRQTSELSNLRNIQVVYFPTFGKNVFLRLVWIHLFLPVLCLLCRVDVLHKLATETPLFCSARRVTTIHDFYYEFLTETHSPKTIRMMERLEALYFSFVTNLCFKKSRALIAVSEATRQEAIERYPTCEDRMVVVHHGATGAMPRADAEWAGFNILCVAKFMEHKGQHLLIRAFEKLLDENPELAETVRLFLRGFHNDEDYFLSVQQQIEESRWGHRIQIVPFCASDHRDDIYRHADLVVLLSSYEGFGLPVLEAQTAGLPVLCSDLPVLRETGGDGAVYVVREDMEDVAHQLKRLACDPEFYNTVQRQARENIGRFSWIKAAKQTIEVYRKL